MSPAAARGRQRLICHTHNAAMAQAHAEQRARDQDGAAHGGEDGRDFRIDIVVDRRQLSIKVGRGQADCGANAGRIERLDVEVDGAAATELAKLFVEVLIAPSFSAEARTIMAAKQNVRLLEVPLDDATRSLSNALDFKRVGGGMLLQSSDTVDLVGDIKVVSKVQPTEQQLKDMLFWRPPQLDAQQSLDDVPEVTPCLRVPIVALGRKLDVQVEEKGRG